MEVTISNYRGVQQAEFSVSPVALIAGRNGQGKSSIAQAVGSALTGQAIPPFFSFKKGEASMLVNRGAAKASVKLLTEAGQRDMAWPSCSDSETGKLASSRIAVGFMRAAELTSEERSKLLTVYLKTLPSKENLSFEMKRVGLGEFVDDVWVMIDRDGWDITLKQKKEHGAKAKGAWEAVTGQKFGTNKVDQWLPQDFTLTDMMDDPAALKETLTGLKAQHQKAIAGSAVDGAHKTRLQEQADNLPTLREENEAAEKAANEASTAVDVFREGAERPAVTTTLLELPCPHCGEAIVVKPGELAKPTGKKPSAAEQKRVAEAIRAYDEELATLNGAVRTASNAAGAAFTALREAEKAARELDALNQKEAPASDLDPEAIGESIYRTEAHIRAVEAYQNAQKYANIIKNNAVLLEILAPEGLRQTRLAQTLESFNNILGDICEVAGWAKVSIGSDMEVDYGGYSYALLSESEKYRVNAVLQVALSEIDKSDVLVFDGADILDPKGRVGLMDILSGSDFKSIVCMTYPSESKAPDLGAMGNTYWIEGGILRPKAKEAA